MLLQLLKILNIPIGNSIHITG